MGEWLISDISFAGLHLQMLDAHRHCISRPLVALHLDAADQPGRSSLPLWSVEDLRPKNFLIANSADGENFASIAGTSSRSTTSNKPSVTSNSSAGMLWATNISP